MGVEAKAFQGKLSHYEKRGTINNIRSKCLLNVLTLVEALGKRYVREELNPWEQFDIKEFYRWIMRNVAVEDVMEILGVSQATAYDYLNTLKELYLIYDVSIPMSR